MVLKKMLSEEEIEIITNNFGHEYFLHYDIGNWKQIKDYKEDIPKIIRKVIIQTCGVKNWGLFNEIMKDITESG